MQDSERWIWPFELVEKIGEGGMGKVYRARYVVNDKLFAVKLLPGDVTDETVLARFQRELEILKKLKHPHIVRCFGGECKDKRPFYAMELVEGGTLEDQLIQRGRLAWELVVEYGLQMCEALAFSHQHGIVHRDIKPGNFLLTGSGKLKLGDFGLASVAAARRITAEGRTMGTYQYMAPEQIRGKEITPQTDLYSLGCVFFELLTGRPPFEGEAAAEILHQHIKSTPPRVGEFAPDCPAGLEQLINDLLQKDPSARPASAEVVAERLKAVTQTIIVKPKLRPFEQPSNNSEPAATTETKSAPTIDSIPGPIAAPTASRGLLWGLLFGYASLLIVIFTLLSQRSQHDEEAEDLWVAALSQQNPPVQIEAAKALGVLGKTSKPAADRLLSAMNGSESKDISVMVAIVSAVGEVGYLAKDATGEVQKIAKAHSEPAVRAAALQAMEKLKASEAPGHSVWYYLNVLTVLIAGGLAAWIYFKIPA